MTEDRGQQRNTPPRLRIKRAIAMSVQIDWTAAAAAQPGKALHVALAIWQSASAQGSNSVVLSRFTLAKFGVARDAVYPALTHLAEAGLIAADRRRGRLPRITVLHNDEKRCARPEGHSILKAPSPRTAVAS